MDKEGFQQGEWIFQICVDGWIPNKKKKKFLLLAAPQMVCSFNNMMVHIFGACRYQQLLVLSFVADVKHLCRSQHDVAVSPDTACLPQV